jgi:hypothetical protein
MAIKQTNILHCPSKIYPKLDFFGSKICHLATLVVARSTFSPTAKTHMFICTYVSVASSLGHDVVKPLPKSGSSIGRWLVGKKVFLLASWCEFLVG